MDIKRALAEELRKTCTRCGGTGKIPGSELAERICRPCHGFGQTLILSEELEAMVIVLRDEIKKISNVVFSERDVVTRLLRRESLNIDS